jgi:rubrerythrin
MPDKPTYLGLLNAVACAETHAHAYLSAWAETTEDPDVRSVLTKVAWREYEHGAAFAKRINELGFEVRAIEDPKHEERMEIARSDRSDLDKLDALGILRFCSDDEPDIFDGFFRDHSIDVQTGELLGRYIAEERDTLRLVSGCKAQLESRGAGASNGSSDARFATMEDKIDAVCRAVEEVRQIVCAQSMPAEKI